MLSTPRGNSWGNSAGKKISADAVASASPCSRIVTPASAIKAASSLQILIGPHIDAFDQAGEDGTLACSRQLGPARPDLGGADDEAYNLYAVPREKSVARFKDQIRNLTQRRAPVTLPDMIEVINPIIRGWGNYYRKANVRKLFHRLDGWIERRLWSFISKRWRNTAWRRYPSSRLITDFGLVRLIYLVPGIRPNLRQSARPT